MNDQMKKTTSRNGKRLRDSDGYRNILLIKTLEFVREKLHNT